MNDKTSNKIIKLTELMEKGILTPDEFTEQKKILLQNTPQVGDAVNQSTENYKTETDKISNDEQFTDFNRNILKLFLFSCMLSLLGFLFYTNPGKILTKELIVSEYVDPNGQLINFENIHCVNILVMTACVSTWSGGGRPGVFAAVNNEIYNSYFIIFFIFAFLYGIFAIPYQFGKHIFLKKSEIQNLEFLEKKIGTMISKFFDRFNTAQGLVMGFIITIILLFIFG